jgi:hypothetical protein
MAQEQQRLPWHTHTPYAQIVRPKFTLNDHSMFSSIKLDEAKSCRVGTEESFMDKNTHKYHGTSCNADILKVIPWVTE